MNKEEIRQFKSLLNQGILRHTNILLDYKFQNALLEIIKDYEQLQQENKQLKERIDKNAVSDYETEKWKTQRIKTLLENNYYLRNGEKYMIEEEINEILKILKGDSNE